ncbi:MAG: head GIN domain-containing protein [Cyclobacteriaceae bacterium]
MKALSTLLILTAISINVSAQRRTIDVSNFSEFSFAVSGNVYLTQGSEEKVEVECSDEIFDKLEFDLSGDRLTIRKDRNWNWRDGFRDSELDVYITMKDIERLTVSGSGSISSENQLSTDDLRLSVSGSGDMELDLNSSEVDIRISGSGSIRLDGTADKTEASISGSGKVKAEDMKSRIFEASISGSGNCYVYATEEVRAKISGSGSVYYNGNPERVNSNASGSGKVKRM